MGNQQMEHDKDKKPQANQPQQQGGQRKNNAETGEPVQLDDKSKTGQQQQKPGMGQREGEHGGQHQQGGQRPGGAGTANR
jgi:hypothetical protein